MNSRIPLLTLQRLGTQFNRSFKSDLKIKWVRPEKIPCINPEKSGDASLLPKIDLTQYIQEVQNLKELEDADEQVKNIFRLENNRRYQTSDLYRKMFIKDVQRHDLDYGSMESKIARMTATIRRMQEYQEIDPRNPRRRVILKEMIDKRKKFLKYLRRWDYKRFEWLIEKLDIIYKPPPAEFHWITRKDSLRKLTDTHCENLKNEKITTYRQYLESQQIGFLEKKLENLQFMRKEQQECNIKITVSEEDILKVKNQLESLKEAKNLSLKKEENSEDS